MDQINDLSNKIRLLGIGDPSSLQKTLNIPQKLNRREHLDRIVSQVAKFITDFKLYEGFYKTKSTEASTRFMNVIAVQKNKLEDIGIDFQSNPEALRSDPVIEITKQVKRYLDNRRLIIDEADKDGDTFLSNACRGYDIERVKLLISLGADVNAINSDGNTPLHIACICGNEVTSKLLLENGAINAPNNAGWTPLHKVVLLY